MAVRLRLRLPSASAADRSDFTYPLPREHRCERDGTAARRRQRRSAGRGRGGARLANRYACARQMRRARREVERLKTFLCRVARDIGRKIADRPGLMPHFAEPLARVMHLLAPCQAL